MRVVLLDTAARVKMSLFSRSSEYACQTETHGKSEQETPEQLLSENDTRSEASDHRWQGGAAPVAAPQPALPCHPVPQAWIQLCHMQRSTTLGSELFRGGGTDSLGAGRRGPSGLAPTHSLALFADLTI